MAELPRRGFLQVATAALSSLFIPPQVFNLTLPEQPKNLVAKIKSGDFGSDGNNYPEKPAEYSLPAEIVTDRKWERILSTENPPASYRQASVYCSSRESTVIHGGWDGVSNRSETWELKNKQWSLLEAGSTPPLSGHKMVNTPHGLFMFGGVITSNEYSNKAYLFNFNNSQWQEISFSGDLLSPLQGMGMMYDQKENVVWVVGGAKGMGITNSISLFRPPTEVGGVWQHQKLGQMSETGTLPLLFEPFVYQRGNDGRVMVYGGLRQESTRRVDSNYVYELGYHQDSNYGLIADVQISTQPLVDYAGPVGGGFDLKKGRLVLNGGSTPNLFGQINWPESVDYSQKENKWRTVSADGGPRWVTKAAGAMDDKGNYYRFGGVYYVDGDPYGHFSNETWILKSVYNTHLPLVVS